MVQEEKNSNCMEKFNGVTKGNSIFDQTNLISIVIKCNAAFIKEISTKEDVITKIYGINNKQRVFIDNHIAVELWESIFV